MPQTIPKPPSSHALEYMAGWKDGANNAAPEDSSYHLRGRPGYAKGHARGVAARLQEWERTKTEYPDEREAT